MARPRAVRFRLRVEPRAAWATLRSSSRSAFLVRGIFDRLSQKLGGGNAGWLIFCFFNELGATAGSEERRRLWELGAFVWSRRGPCDMAILGFLRGSMRRYWRQSLHGCHLGGVMSVFCALAMLTRRAGKRGYGILSAQRCRYFVI